MKSLKPRKKPNIEALPYQIKRNKSWLASVRLAFLLAIWWAPTSFTRSMKMPLGALLLATGMTLGTLVTWIFTRLTILVAGVLGYVSPAVPATSSQD